MLFIVTPYLQLEMPQNSSQLTKQKKLDAALGSPAHAADKHRQGETVKSSESLCFFMYVLGPAAVSRILVLVFSSASPDGMNRFSSYQKRFLALVSNLEVMLQSALVSYRIARSHSVSSGATRWVIEG